MQLQSCLLLKLLFKFINQLKIAFLNFLSLGINFFEHELRRMQLTFAESNHFSHFEYRLSDPILHILHFHLIIFVLSRERSNLLQQILFVSGERLNVCFTYLSVENLTQVGSRWHLLFLLSMEHLIIILFIYLSHNFPS